MTESPSTNLAAEHAKLDLQIKQTELAIKQAELKGKELTFFGQGRIDQ